MNRARFLLVPVMGLLVLTLSACDGGGDSNRDRSETTTADETAISAEVGPCPVETIDGRMVMQVRLDTSTAKKFTAKCVSTEASCKDLVIARGYWLYLTNNLGEDITIKLKKHGQNDPNEMHKLFGMNGKVDVAAGATVQLQVLSDADQQTSDYMILGGWDYGDPGPTIRVP